MYNRRTLDAKHNKTRQWALPDRVFFAAGACHILAAAFLERYPDCGGKPFWIRPAPGFWGNHAFISILREGQPPLAFDYHGYLDQERMLAHFWRRGRHWYPGRDGTLVEIIPEALVSTPLSKTYDGLHLREPQDFLHDALPRARIYLDRFDQPPIAR